MRIRKYALSVLFVMAASCVAAHAQQQAPKGGGGSDAPTPPPAANQSNTSESDRIHADSYIPEQPGAIKHPSDQCVTQHDPRDGCTVDTPGEKGAACKCKDDDGYYVRGKLE